MMELSHATRSSRAFEILALGVVGGLAGDLLLRAMPWGLNVTLATSGLVAAGVWLVRRHGVKTGPEAAWLAITAVLLGAAFLRRDAVELTTFDMLALIATLAFAAASLQGEVISRWEVVDHVRGLVTAAVASIAGSLVLLSSDIQWKELPEGNRFRHLRGVALGVIVAVPLLLIFGALFASADQVFSNVITNTLSWDLGSLTSHLFFICFWGTLVAGLLRWGMLGRPVTYLTPKPAGAPASIVPVATTLILVDALFLLFVVIQLRYFFGGATLVEATSGLTYAEYARRGFFELVTASALVLPVLLGADHLTRAATAPQLRVFRQLAGVLLVLLAVVMVSALERMRLYVSAYGLSTIRLYSTAFMILLAGVFAWFAWTVLRGKPQRFAFGAWMQALAVLAGLHVLNPDAFIVRTNLNRPAAERPFDAKYAASLGADAVPALISALPSLRADDQCAVASALLKRWGDTAPDWRTWNWSRSRARHLVHERVDTLRAICPKETTRGH